MQISSPVPADLINQLASVGLVSTLNIRVISASPSRVVAEMPSVPATATPMRIMNGGASLALAESLAGIASYLNCPPDLVPVGSQISANHLRPTPIGVVLTAVATPLHLGSKTHLWNINISLPSSDLVCTARVTNHLIPKNPAIKNKE